MAAVTFHERVMRLMQTELRFHEREETGGFLLGYVQDKEHVDVIEVVDGGYHQVQRTQSMFQFDMAYVQHVSMLLCNAYEPPLTIVGMWHKHCHQMEPVFSLADDALHEQLMLQNAGTCASVLFLQSETELDDYALRVYIIDEKNGEREVPWTIT